MDFVEYTPAHRQICTEMFLSNTPAFFAPVELPLFQSWLDDLESGKEPGLRAGRRKDGSLYNYVVYLNNTPIACGGFYVRSDNFEAHMAWGMVHRAYHRQGIGREFLRFRITRIRQMFPYSPILLDTTQFSVGFYERQGFVVTKVTKDSYAPGMDRYDMQLRADSIVF